MGCSPAATDMAVQKGFSEIFARPFDFMTRWSVNVGRRASGRGLPMATNHPIHRHTGHPAASSSRQQTCRQRPIGLFPLATSSWTMPTNRLPSAHWPTCWRRIYGVPSPTRRSALDSPAQRRSAPPDDPLPSEMNVPMRVATYTRISTDEDHQPYSLGAQAERLGNYVASQDGWELVRRFTDQASGATTERPGLQRALNEAKANRFDLLLVYRVDRFARSVRGLAQLLEELDAAGVAFRSATEPFDTTTPAGRMMVQMLGVFAEFERATSSTG